MPRADLHWGALHYEDSGSGDPLLLISGLNGLAAPFRGIVPVLATQFRVITHDHRGLGSSDRWDGAYSVDQIAKDAVGLMDGLGIARAHIVGHSLGGAVAQALAADRADKVGGVVIYASWPGKDAYFDRVMAMRRDVLLHQGVEAFIRTGPIGIYPPRWIAEHDAAFTAAEAAAVAAFPGVDIMLRRMQACVDHDRRQSLGGITAPTMVIGVQDDTSTPFYGSKELAASIPAARLAALPFGGHNAHLTVPEELTACLLDFLTSPRVTQTLKTGTRQ